MFKNRYPGSLVLIGAVLVACAGNPPEVAPPEDTRSSRSSSIVHRNQPLPMIEADRPQMSVKDDPRLGSPTAKIGIVEFSDFQCPYCRDFHRMQFVRIKERYIDTGVVQFFFKDMPLRMHAQAVPAAVAAQCAGAQGRFWEMHDALFDHQDRLNPALYPELANRMGLDKSQFTSCLKNPIVGRGIAQDLSVARNLGLTGTPSFVIGTIEKDVVTVVRQARGAPAFEEFAREIEKLRQD